MERTDLIETLNDLIENCKDGELGFGACAEHARSPDLRVLFERRARGCGEAAQQLKAVVTRLGGVADDGGSASGALHRGWVSLRGVLALDDDKAMLIECERGEDLAVARYRRALEDDLPQEIEVLVRRQYEGAKRNHDEIKALRERLTAPA
jgi:uncharacterized protein (TIGR02284 family)